MGRIVGLRFSKEGKAEAKKDNKTPKEGKAEAKKE